MSASFGRVLLGTDAFCRKLEAGEIRPSRQLAELLAEQLGVPLEEREKYVRFGRAGSSTGPAPPIPQHNLPNHPSSFIGRERELAAVQQLLHHARLVTLTGAGGIGKTRGVPVDPENIQILGGQRITDCRSKPLDSTTAPVAANNQP